MQACGRLVARMGEQDVDRNIAACIEIDGGDMALVMGDLDDPAIDDRYVAARQIGLDIGRNVVTIGEDSQLVGPIVEQPDRLVRLRAGPDEAPMLVGDFKAVAIGAGHDGRAPAFGKARNIKHLVGDAITQDQAARPKAFAIASEDGEMVDGAGDGVGPGTDQPDRGITRQLLPRLGQDVQRWLVIVAEQAMRVAGEAIARQAGIENGDLAAGTAELQGGGEAGKAAADDDDVIHGDGLRVVDGGGWAGLGAQDRPALRAVWLTQLRSISGAHPIFFAIEVIAAPWESYSLRCSSTMRTERSRTSGGEPARSGHHSSSQGMEPPANPVRFTAVRATWRGQRARGVQANTGTKGHRTPNRPRLWNTALHMPLDDRPAG